MTEDEYIAQRVDEQIGWYDAKARSSQSAFKILRVVEILLAVTIPLLSGFAKDLAALQIWIGIMGVVIAAVAGLLSLFQFQENWIRYRVTCEGLKNEKFLFLTRATPYDISSPLGLLVQRVEGVVSKETAGWSLCAAKAEKGKQDSLT